MNTPADKVYYIQDDWTPKRGAKKRIKQIADYILLEEISVVKHSHEIPTQKKISHGLRLGIRKLQDS